MAISVKQFPNPLNCDEPAYEIQVMYDSDVSNGGIFPSHATHFFLAKSFILSGAGKGVRTLDLLVGNETLYH